MPEPTAPAMASLALMGSAATVQGLTAFGIQLGLRPDVLIAGFAGALVAIILLDSVPARPGEEASWQGYFRLTLRRLAVVLASSLASGYIVPWMAPGQMEVTSVLGSSFIFGAAAQQILAKLVARFQQEKAP